MVTSDLIELSLQLMPLKNLFAFDKWSIIFTTCIIVEIRWKDDTYVSPHHSTSLSLERITIFKMTHTPCIYCFDVITRNWPSFYFSDVMFSRKQSLYGRFFGFIVNVSPILKHSLSTHCLFDYIAYASVSWWRLSWNITFAMWQLRFFSCAGCAMCNYLALNVHHVIYSCDWLNKSIYQKKTNVL